MPAGRIAGETLDSLRGYAGSLFERAFSSPPNYETTLWEDFIREDLMPEARNFLQDPALQSIETGTRELLEEISPEDPFLRRWAADSVLARCAYLLCRLTKPEVVVETGVAHGVSSAFVLAALGENGGGSLYSVDLPPPRRGARRFQGIAVPEGLKDRWSLRNGPSRRVLPGLLREVGAVDLFLHDSLHTSRNMIREFDLAWPVLRPGGFLIADDVERNAAFGDLRRRDPSLWRVVSDREVVPLHGKAAPVAFGVAVK